jgi:hypothetical protein
VKSLQRRGLLGSGQSGPLPSQLGLQSSVLLGQVEELPRGKPLARSGDGIPQSYLAISKDMHGPPRARHRNIIA